MADCQTWHLPQIYNWTNSYQMLEYQEPITGNSRHSHSHNSVGTLKHIKTQRRGICSSWGVSIVNWVYHVLGTSIPVPNPHRWTIFFDTVGTDVAAWGTRLGMSNPMTSNMIPNISSCMTTVGLRHPMNHHKTSNLTSKNRGHQKECWNIKAN